MDFTIQSFSIKIKHALYQNRTLLAGGLLQSVICQNVIIRHIFYFSLPDKWVQNIAQLQSSGMYKNYFKTAWRNLIKNKTYSIINIAGLGVGMTITMLIGLWIHSELSFNKNFSNYPHIARVMQNQTFNGEVQSWQNVPMPLGPVLRNTYGTNFTYVVLSASTGERMLALGEKRIKISGNYMDVDAPAMLSLHMLKGSRTGLREMNSILLSASAAASFFGDADPINKVLRLEEKSEVKVTGVYEDIAENSSFADLHFIAPFQLMVQNRNLQSVLKNPWGASWFQLYVQTAANTDMAVVSKKIKDAKTKNISADATKNKPEIFLQPMSGWHLYADFKNGVNAGGRILYVWLFGIVGLFVLLLACINFMNLSTARSEKRAREVGVRKAIGSMRRQLIYQFFTESLLVSLLSFIMALLLLTAIMPFFNGLSDKKMPLPFSNIAFWVTGILFTFITGLIAGVYPALYLSSFKAVKVLKGTYKAGRFSAMPRKVLLVLQFTVSIVMIVGTMVVYKQIQFARNRPVGYQTDGIVSFNTGELSAHFESFRTDLLATGKIMETAASETDVTNTFITNSGFNWRGKDPSLQEEFTTVGVTHEFGKTIGWTIMEGRDFSRNFGTDSTGIIINQAAAKYLGFQHPVGEELQWGKNGKVHIIGIINDMVTQSPYEPVKQSFFYLRKGYLGTVNVRVNPNSAMTESLSAVKAVFKKYNPTQPFEYRFIDVEYSKNFAGELRVGKLAAFFAALGIFISCLGLFGMASFVAEQRTREIGVRKVLGASVFNLWRLLSKDFVLLVMIALLIAVPLAYYGMHTWLQNYQYRTGVSWWVFVTAGSGALLITLLTVSFQSIRAALANPVKSLRTE